MKWLAPLIVLLVLGIQGKAQTQPDTNEIYTFVEQMPQFPGGSVAQEKFIKENLKIPKVSRDERKQGRVVVGFVVERDGTLSAVKVLKSLGAPYDQAVLDCIQAMPPWIPGMQKGQKVRVRQMFPIDLD